MKYMRNSSALMLASDGSVTSNAEMSLRRQGGQGGADRSG
jgi:hypothetical protein